MGGGGGGGNRVQSTWRAEWPAECSPGLIFALFSSCEAALFSRGSEAEINCINFPKYPPSSSSTKAPSSSSKSSTNLARSCPSTFLSLKTEMIEWKQFIRKMI